MNTYCVYKHTSPSNKVYIGITYHTNPAIRWGPGGCGYAYNQHFWNAIRKYGWDNFKHEILHQNLTREQALALESDLIHEYQATNPDFGYNKITGSSYMGETNPEYRQQISERVKNQIWVHNDTEELYIPNSAEQAYLAQGWMRGRLLDKNVYLHRQGYSDIKVSASDVDAYVKAGWSLGRGKAVASSIRQSRRHYLWYYDDAVFETSRQLTNFLRAHGYPNIVPSTVTSMLRGSFVATYADLSSHIRKERID